MARKLLAVPGSGAGARRARLEKLNMKELKTKLREKGLKVSGRKADLVERLMEELPKTRKIPQPQEPAIFDKDVFIPLQETIQELEPLLQEKRVVFLRAGVASGKVYIGAASLFSAAVKVLARFVLLLLIV